MKELILVSILCAFQFLGTKSRAETDRILMVDFKREFLETDNREFASGTIYLLPPHHITVKVTDPINQRMIFSEKKLEIYYPQEKKLFRFLSDYPFHLSFFEALLGVLQKDYGLGDIGYVLVRRTEIGDTTTTTWKPPKPLGKRLGEFILAYEGERIIFAESRKPDGSLVSRAAFSDHYEHNGYYFPLEITTTRFSEQDSSVERVWFAEPLFNTTIPDDIKYFTIPPDVEVEESTW